MDKGLDRNFLHYGIRKDDLELIRTLCVKHELDSDWVVEDVLKVYHERKVNSIEISDADTERVVNEAIQNVILRKDV